MTEEDRKGFITEDQLFDLLFRSVWHGREGHISGELTAIILELPEIIGCMNLDKGSRDTLEAFRAKIVGFEANFQETREGGEINWGIVEDLENLSPNVMGILGGLNDEKYQENFYQKNFYNTTLFPTYEEAIKQGQWTRVVDPSSLTRFI